MGQSLVEFQLNNMLTSSILSFFVLLFCSGSFGSWSNCQLYDAAVAGNFRKVEKLLQTPNANPDRGCSTDRNIGRSIVLTPLMGAAKNGHMDIVVLLLDANANVNLQIKGRKTALIFAAWEGHKDVVELLLASNANINQQDSDGYTALMLATSQGKKEVVELLLRRGADTTLKDKDGDTACYWNNKVDYIIFNCPGAALFEASLRGNLDLVKELLSNGADVNATENSNGETPLLLAAWKGHKDLVELLLDNNANVNQASWGKTALIHAAYEGHKDVVALLLPNNAIINPQDDSLLSALMLAAENGHKDVVEVLLLNNANINTLENMYAHTACDYNHYVDNIIPGCRSLGSGTGCLNRQLPHLIKYLILFYYFSGYSYISIMPSK